MIELISIVCSLIICVLTPIEVAKIRKGWVRPRFKGDRARFLAAYKKQLNLLMGLGIVFGVISIVLSFVEQTPGENYVKIFAGLIWFAVAIICFVSRGRIPDPTAEPPPAAA